jgi:DNA modification methylase
MEPYYADDAVTLYHGDCLDVLRTLPDSSVDAVCTDPPYGLEFMGREWDKFDGKALWNDKAHGVDNQRPTDEHGVSTGLSRWNTPRPQYVAGHPFQSWCEQWATECLRVLKPGGHLLAFGGTRTWHRLACAIEDAGFEVRDSIAWLYGSGFPKSLDVSKAIDKAAGAERTEVIGTRGLAKWRDGAPAGDAMKDDGGIRQPFDKVNTLHAPATDDARTWQGWGTALKPGHEPVVCARKPFSPVPWGEVAGLHHQIGTLLWQAFTPAKRAALSSPSSPHGQHGAWCVSARVGAAMDTSPGASDATVTFSSPATAATSLSIARSWGDILAALSAETRTSTISTASSTTTALRTLRSLLAPITSPTTMPRCGCLLAGSPSTAPNAAEGSSDEWSRWLLTLSASVAATAIEGIALAAASAFVQVAASLSVDPAAESSVAPTATTGADARSGSPAHEPIVVARKPLAGTVAANVLAHGTGALNIDGCRVEMSDADRAVIEKAKWVGRNLDRAAYGDYGTDGTDQPMQTHPAGRWPANVVLDPDAAGELDRQSGNRPGMSSQRHIQPPEASDGWGTFGSIQEESREGYNDQGGASRFFPVFANVTPGTAARADYHPELDARVPTPDARAPYRPPLFRYTPKAPTTERPRDGATAHPTVKPLDLMRWLVRLVTPPGGTVLDPFAGSGTTAEACIVEGFRCITVEREPDYLPLIMARLNKPIQPDIFGGIA